MAVSSSRVGSPRAGSTRAGSPRAGSPRAGSPRKKVTSFTWEIEGSDYVRQIAFKPLKDDEKIGFGLGGRGQRTEVVAVRVGTQAYWAGVLVGYKVINVNKKAVNDISAASAIQDAISLGKQFSIGFQVPNKPDWPEKNKDDVKSSIEPQDSPIDELLLDEEDIPIMDQDINESPRASKSRKGRKRGSRRKHRKARREDDEDGIIDHGQSYGDGYTEGMFMRDDDMENFVPRIKKTQERVQIKVNVPNRELETALSLRSESPASRLSWTLDSPREDVKSLSDLGDTSPSKLKRKEKESKIMEAQNEKKMEKEIGKGEKAKGKEKKKRSKKKRRKKAPSKIRPESPKSEDTDRATVSNTDLPAKNVDKEELKEENKTKRKSKRKKRKKKRKKEEPEEKKDKFRFSPRSSSSKDGAYSLESLEKKTKHELEELERQKAKEYEKLKKNEDDLRALIKEKEAELKRSATRQVLADLKELRKQSKALKDQLQRTLDELDRIRSILRQRLSELEAGIKNLARDSKARDLKLTELEQTVSQLRLKMLRG